MNRPLIESPVPAMLRVAFQDDLEARVIAAIHTIFDPEIPVDIYDLGLIYNIDIRDDPDGDDGKHVHVQMTLTAPACPEAGVIPGQVESKVRGVSGVTDASVELVWDPPWTAARMSEAARLQLGMDLDY